MLRFFKTDADRAALQFTKDELLILRCIMGEILGGFGWDFSHTGWTKEGACQLQGSIRTNYDSAVNGNIVCSFTTQEINFLVDAIDATIKKLGTSYSTRVGGFSIQETRQLQAKLQAAEQEL